MDIKQKFDIVVGNPPFSNGNGKTLYPAFFEKSLILADQVAMIFPVDLMTNSSRMKNHVQRIKTHASFISESVNHHFLNIAAANIKYVVASKNNDNKDSPIHSDLKTLYPERERLTVIRGNASLETADRCPNGVQCLKTIFKNDIPIYYTVRREVIERQRPQLDSSVPWVVLVAALTHYGDLRVIVVENSENLRWSGDLLAIPVQSEEDGTNLKKWLQSDEMREHINQYLTMNGRRGVTKSLMETFPTYK